MFKCDVCEREFKSEIALRGHTRVHKARLYNPPKFLRHVSCIETRKEMHVRYFDEYLKKLSSCRFCSTVFEAVAKKLYFCSQSCAAKYNNRGRVRSEESRLKTSLTLKKKFETIERVFVTRKEKISRKQKERNTPHKIKRLIAERACEKCQKNMILSGRQLKNRFCSRTCVNDAHSERTIARIANSGTTNFSTRISGFTYKGITIDCDSKLEAAGIIYLIDVMGASQIERCRSIINFKDSDGKNHRFLPDFYATIGTNRFLIEVKQIYKKSCQINNYNRFFTEKKNALNAFAISKNLKPLWLDFDYDVRFKTIYKDFLKNKY